MKKLIFALIALAIALTACKKHRTSDEPEVKLPEPEYGEMIVAGRTIPFNNPICINTINISDLYDGFFHLTFQNINEKKMEICLSSSHDGEKMDLSKVDPVSGTEEMPYLVTYDEQVIASGTNTASAKYCREGSYLIVKKFGGWYYEVELSLLTEGGVFYACKYKGALIPRIYNPYKPMVYYDGAFYIPSIFNYEMSSGTINLIFKIDGGMEFSVMYDEAYNDNDIDLSLRASSTPTYSINVSDGINPSKTIVCYAQNGLKSYGHAGSSLWSKVVGGKVSANGCILTDEHILAFDFYSKSASLL